MYRNNFDTSSTGTNIEFFGCYDTDLSKIEFDENFDVIQRTHRGDACLCFFTDYGQIEAPEKIGDVYKIRQGTTKNDLLKLDWYNSENFFIIKSEILDKPLKDWEDYSDILELKKDFEIITTKGYCQGDCCDVLINKTALRKLWGNVPDIKALSDDIDHYFWDCPISANFIINGVCYDYDLDRYEWQREEFIKQVSDDSGISEDVLSSLAPEILDYN